MSALKNIHAHVLEGNDATLVWQLTPAERLQRMSRKRAVEWVSHDQAELLFHPQAVIDDSVFDALLSQSDVALVGDAGERLAVHVGVHVTSAQATAWLQGGAALPEGVRMKNAVGLAGTYNARLRKRENPYAAALSASNKKAVEWRFFTGSYKGVTDLVTKYCWPIPAFHVTRLCAKLGLSPNFVTALSGLLVLLALYWFWKGEYGLGLVAAWIMTFLDTVDGKLARCTLTSSPIGNIFDHGIDLVHPPFWYTAWGIGLVHVGLEIPASELATCLWLIWGGYIVGRLMEGYFIRRYKIMLHVWRRFDSWFRLIVARRNPNMILLTLAWALHRPDIGFLAITVWTVAGVVVHAVQLMQAEWTRSRGRVINTWLAA